MKWMSTPSISVLNCGRGVQFLLALAPVVICRPVARQRLQRRQLHALRTVVDGLLFGPAGRENPSAEFVQILFRNVDVEGAHLGMGHCSLGAAVFSSSHVIPFWIGLAAIAGLKSATVLCANGGSSAPAACPVAEDLNGNLHAMWITSFHSPSSYCREPTRGA
jgi:hypothetical protein